MVGHRHHVGGHDLVGVQQVPRIKELLDFVKRRRKRTKLPQHKRRATQTIAMFTTDCAANSPNLFVELIGEQIHLGDVRGARQIQERPEMQLSVARMPEQRGCHLLLFENVLHARQEIGQFRRWNRDILHEWQWPRLPFQTIERRRVMPRQLPKQFVVEPIRRDIRTKRKLCFVLHKRHDFGESALHFVGRFPLKLHQQHGFGFLGNQKLITRIHFPSETQMPAIHQIARTRLQRQEFHRGQRRLFNRIEKQQQATGFRRQGERP